MMAKSIDHISQRDIGSVMVDLISHIHRGNRKEIDRILSDPYLCMSRKQSCKILLEAIHYNDLLTTTTRMLKRVNVHVGGEQPLRHAAGYSSLEMVNLLLEAGAKAWVNESIALRVAASRGSLEIVNRLLQAGANVNANNGEPLW